MVATIIEALMYVCICHPLTDGCVRDLIREQKVKTFQQLVDKTYAATGCGSCKDQLKCIFDQTLAETQQKTNEDSNRDTIETDCQSSIKSDTSARA